MWRPLGNCPAWQVIHPAHSTPPPPDSYASDNRVYILSVSLNEILNHYQWQISRKAIICGRRPPTSSNETLERFPII